MMKARDAPSNKEGQSQLFVFFVFFVINKQTYS